MSHDDVLRARLSAADPAGGPVDPATSSRAHELMEHAMTTTELSPPTAAEPGRNRRPLLLAAAAAVVALAVGTTLALSGGSTPAPARPAPTTVALSAPDGLGAASCAPFDVAVLRGMPVALSGTVVAVDPANATLDVDRWYRGGTSDQVTIAIAAGQTSAALDGVDLVQGGRYLLTATDGTLNGCGFSGPATPELQKAYDEAFGG